MRKVAKGMPYLVADWSTLMYDLDLMFDDWSAIVVILVDWSDCRPTSTRQYYSINQGYTLSHHRDILQNMR